MLSVECAVNERRRLVVGRRTSHTHQKREREVFTVLLQSLFLSTAIFVSSHLCSASLACVQNVQISGAGGLSVVDFTSRLFPKDETDKVDKIEEEEVEKRKSVLVYTHEHTFDGS